MGESHSGRIVIATFGSAGDLFPYIPVANALRERGCEVRFAVPRALTLYLRAIGWQSLALGNGSEMRVFGDARAITTRCDGWSSWRTILVGYIEPTLHADVAAVERLIQAWRPHALIAGSFGVAGRIAAMRLNVPIVDLSLSPQQLEVSAKSSSFALRLRRTVADALRLHQADPAVTEAIWGQSERSLLLHDSTLLGTSTMLGRPVVGYPFWDELPSSSAQLNGVRDWITAQRGRPVFLLTLGSFIGAHSASRIASLCRAISGLGGRTVVLGPSRVGGLTPDEEAGVLTSGYLPLSAVAPGVDAVVHHGGIGTMFGTLLSRKPALILPQAFDQAYNARLIADSGSGLSGQQRPVDECLLQLVEDESFVTTAGAVADQLTAKEDTLSLVCSMISSAGLMD